MATSVPQFRRRVYVEPTIEEENRFFAKICKLVPPSKNIKDIRFRPGEDWSGEPALRITTVTKKNYKPSDANFQELKRAGDILRDAVLNSDYGRWQYVRTK